MGCCGGCMKWTIIILNVLVFLMGLVAVGFGIYVLVDKSEILDLVGNTPEMPAFLDKTAIILIVGGTLISLLAMIGICGAYKSNKRLLCVYGVVLAVIMALEIVIVILAVVYRGEIDEEFKSTLLKTLRTQYVMPKRPNEGVNGFSSAWDSLQYELECCGVQNHLDYKDASYWHTTDKLVTNETMWPVPRSCCQYTNPWEYPDNFDELTYASGPCYPSWNTSNTWAFMGCHEKVKDELYKASFMIIGAAAVTAVTQILLLLFAWALFCGCCGTKEVLV